MTGNGREATTKNINDKSSFVTFFTCNLHPAAAISEENMMMTIMVLLMMTKWKGSDSLVN